MWIPAAVLLCAAAVCGIGVRIFRQRKSERGSLNKMYGEVPEVKSISNARDYWEAYCAGLKAGPGLDEHTWNNLNMDEVWQRLNACLSEAGDIVLYRRLREHHLSAGIERQERLANLFGKSAHSRYKAMYYLKRFGRSSYHAMKTLTLTPALLDCRWKRLVIMFALLPFCTLILLPIHTQAFALALAGSLILNVIATYVLRSQIISYKTAYPLSALVHWSKKIVPIIEESDPELAEQLRGCQAICKKASLPFFFMRFSELCEQATVIDISSFFLLPILSYYGLVRFIKKETLCISRLYNLVGEIDVACAVCSFRESLPYHSRPEYTAENGITAESVYHPLLEQAVPNSIRTSKGILLTGSNASGKSTFIKCLAVNIVLAQAINTCCAKHLCVKRANVVTAMAVSDNLIEGDSYFIAEIKAMKRLVAAANQSFAYLFIDEILRGTNTAERLAAAFSFLDYFAQKDVLCFAASHDIELVSMTSPAYAQFHFTEYIEAGKMLFDYKIRAGAARGRNAIKLLEIYGFPVAVVAQANAALAACRPK